MQEIVYTCTVYIKQAMTYRMQTPAYQDWLQRSSNIPLRLL